MQGKLVTEDFLLEGIRGSTAWTSLAEEEFRRLTAALRGSVDAVRSHAQPNESVTVDESILPALEALGWRHHLLQQRAGRQRTDVPDCLLFADAAAKSAAAAEPREDRRYLHGLTFVECKRWERPLDRGEATDRFDPDVPSNQMLRYLSQVEVASEQRIAWGILTNGRLWRLYCQKSRNRADEYIEFDLAELVAELQDLSSPEATRRLHLLRCFVLFFRPQAFQPDAALGQRTFLDFARSEARLWEARVARSLRDVVFEQAFPRLLTGFVAQDLARPSPPDQAYLDQVRDAALVFLYRLLFVLHAEDRDLLPVRDRRYAGYSLRRIREDVARRVDQGDTFSRTQQRYFGDLRNLFRAIGAGDDAIGVPPYNGGLFDDARLPVLARLGLHDEDCAFVLDALSRQAGPERRLWINYRDLSVQQLGSIYERLLEYRAAWRNGRVEIAQDAYSRRVSGSYYTDESLVQLVIDRTVGVVVREKRQAFLDHLAVLKRSRRPLRDRLEELGRLDPSAALMDLKVCDPAMGSGHFLVSLVDYLTDAVLQLMSEAAAAGATLARGATYESPLARRAGDIRARILAQAHEHRWPVAEEQLDDRHIVRRMVLKRVVYGVDLNPMAVELAKLSLWLHSFTVGAPLSFLDHHLRDGNALVGSRVAAVRRRLQTTGLFGAAYSGMLAATDMMAHIEEMTDSDIAEVQESASTFVAIEKALEPYRRLLHLDTAHFWLRPGDVARRKEWLDPHDVLGGLMGDPLGLVLTPPGRDKRLEATLLAAAAAAERERFFHWELMFPEVWYERGREKSDGGFDVLLGNPPWNRIKLQDNEFFAERRPEIASAPTASERKRLIARLQKADDPLWPEYQAAATRAETLADYTRRSDQYPFLGGGDTNLYALFVERAASLLRPCGLLGFVVPSGIAADKEKARFFAGLAAAGRLWGVLDFENRKAFFPDVHASFKFCVFVAGGTSRTTPTAECAFHLQAVDDLADPERRFHLGPEDFARVNPNTRTAPVFRTRRTAEIVRAVYGRLPVLRRHARPESAAWPVRYATMFHMTNDSGLFRTPRQLERAGFCRVATDRWERGDSVYVPLYEGKMVQMYDHRAASVEVNPDNVHRPGHALAATDDQHRDPRWTPAPQFWVPAEEVAGFFERLGVSSGGWCLAFKDATASTNARTMIAAVVPAVGIGNTLPILLGQAAAEACLMLAIFNSFAFDFVARQKVHGQHLNLFIIEQLPVPPPEALQGRASAGVSVADVVRDRVARLTYTARDLDPFGREAGPGLDRPFPWNSDERFHLMCQIDALMFRLYGLEEDDTRYVLSTFESVRDDNLKAFGHYRTQEAILAYMRAQAAGDYQTRIML